MNPDPERDLTRLGKFVYVTNRRVIGPPPNGFGQMHLPLWKVDSVGHLFFHRPLYAVFAVMLGMLGALLFLGGMTASGANGSFLLATGVLLLLAAGGLGLLYALSRKRVVRVSAGIGEVVTSGRFSDAEVRAFADAVLGAQRADR